MTGRDASFARYAFPPNELGYCGSGKAAGIDELAAHADEFDGAWPYLQAIADAAGVSDPLDEDVVRSYWVGGPLLDKVDADALLVRLRDRVHRPGHRVTRRRLGRARAAGAPQLSRLRGVSVGTIPRP